MPTLERDDGRVLALPREAGTPGAAAARELVAAHLEALGYQVERQRFAFAPSSLNGFPVFGAGLGGLALLLLPLLTGVRAARLGARLLVLAGGLRAARVLAVGIGLGWLPLGGESREDANLIATRGDAPVRRWIVAHLDTKAQGQSMAGRLVAVWVIGSRSWCSTALALARLAGPLPCAAGAAGAAARRSLAGALAGRGRLRGASPGARDNGSGVAARAGRRRSRLDDPAHRHPASPEPRSSGWWAPGSSSRQRGASCGRRWSSTSTPSTRRASSPS